MAIQNMTFRRRGTAVAMALVFATILLLMAIGFVRQLRQAHPQNRLIDERVKVELLANSAIDKAILKFQLFQGDYYAAVAASKLGYHQPLQDFFINDTGLRYVNFGDASSSFSNHTIGVVIASVSLLTDWKWNTEALRIIANVTYTDSVGRNVDKDVVRIVKLDRRLNTPWGP